MTQNGHFSLNLKVTPLFLSLIPPFLVREPTLDDWIATVAAPAVFANFVWNIGHSTFQLQKFVLENDWYVIHVLCIT